MEGYCDWKGCKKASTLGYLEKELCSIHWDLLCEEQDKGKGNAALKKIGLPPEQERPKEVLEEDSEESGITLPMLELEPEEEETPQVPLKAPKKKSKKTRKRRAKKI